MEIISVTEAKSRFSELISRAASGERIIIQRREQPVAVLISATELNRLERLSRTARELALALGQNAELLEQIELGKVHPAMVAFGLWRDEPGFATLVDEVYANRRRQVARLEVTWES